MRAKYLGDPQVRTSDKGIDFIKEMEGCILESYQDVKGVWTIGVGHTKDVHQGMVVTEDEAEYLLREDLISAENGVERVLALYAEQWEYDAMVSLAFNIGNKAFGRSSVVFYFNRRKKQHAAESFKLWNKCRIGGTLQEINGLTRRRAREAKLFLTGVYDAT